MSDVTNFELSSRPNPTRPTKLQTFSGRLQTKVTGVRSLSEIEVPPVMGLRNRSQVQDQKTRINGILDFRREVI